MTIGEVTREFVEYWQPIVKEEGDSRLIDHLMALEAWDSDPQDEEGFEKVMSVFANSSTNGESEGKKKAEK